MGMTLTGFSVMTAEHTRVDAGYSALSLGHPAMNDCFYWLS